MSGPFFCQSCGRRSAFPLEHKTLGWICQHCLCPLTPRKRRRSIFPSLRQQYYADMAGVVVRSRYKSKAERLIKVAERDGWICQLCGAPVDPKAGGLDRPSVDHIQRRREGGSNVLENLRLAHQSCNELRERPA